jgi:trehalose/maltose transport system permease protein
MNAGTALRWLYWPLALAIVAACAFPLVYAAATSLKSGTELFSPSLWVQAPTLQNYVHLLRQQDFGRNLLNSLLVAGGVTAASLALSLLAAWALGRVTFRGRGTLLFTILSASMFPQVAVLSGMYELIRGLGLYDSLQALLLADLLITLPFTVWVLVTFMRGLPREVEEAAMMDGIGLFTLIFRVFMPLLWPAMVATGLLAFIAAWNEFLFALTFTITPQMRTVPLAIALVTGHSAYEIPWGSLMAASVIVTLPLVVLVVLFQRHIVAGLTAGAVR